MDENTSSFEGRVPAPIQTIAQFALEAQDSGVPHAEASLSCSTVRGVMTNSVVCVSATELIKIMYCQIPEPRSEIKPPGGRIGCGGAGTTTGVC